MQTVLSIDISSNLAEAVVANIDGKNIEILERHKLDITDFWNHLSDKTPVDLSSSQEGSAALSAQLTPANPISEILSKLNYTWNNAILTIPPDDYLSLNIDLPFNDNRNISRILDLEVQDLVPFDIDDFHICHKTLGLAPPSEADTPRYDTHVGVIAKRKIGKIMEVCHQANFEPVIVTTPCSTVGSILNLAPLYFADNSLIIYERYPHYYLLTTFEGQIRNEKIITAGENFSLNGASGASQKDRSVMLEFKLFVASNEKRYGQNLEKIYYFGNNFSQAELQNAMARPIEVLELKEFLPVENNDAPVASMAAIYADENNTGLIISNFRARQFAYNQKLKYILRSSRVLLPYLAILAAVFAVYLGTKFLMNEYQISRLNTAMNTEIRKALPGFEIADGQELTALQGENQKLETQLNDISSLSHLTPLDLLLEISKDLPSSLGLAIKSVKIRDNKIVVDGSAKGYSDVENVRKILERKPLYQRVRKAETSSISAAPGMRPFSFEIWVKE